MAEFAVDEHTRLLCHFNTSLDADHARGEPHHSEHTILTTGGAGRFGEAAVLVDGMTRYSLVPGGGGIAYEVAGNLPGDTAGTVEFFIRVMALSRIRRNSFFACGAENAQRLNIFCDPKKEGLEHSRLWFWANNDPDFAAGTGYVTAGCMIAPLLDGAWHHLAVSWQGDSVYFHLDGQLVQRAAKTIVFPFPTIGKMTISHPRSRAAWLLDELRISDICRYPARDVDRGEATETQP